MEHIAPDSTAVRVALIERYFAARIDGLVRASGEEFLVATT